jgi:isoleucyl-tRNA synthetase
MFEPVSPTVSFPELDERWLAFWEEHRIFDQAVAQRRGGPEFVFYEGPPTANGMPHPGHVLTRVMKDVFLRYRAMTGHHVPRRAGWDTHGLPVEVEVEKTLGIHGREEIERYGVEAFSRKCIDSVFKYIDEWRRMTARIGFWIDLDDAYVTFHQSYVESVWWALKTLFDQGLLYQGYKVVWWWPQGGTALSSGEVGQGYKTVDDPSVVVRFPLAGDAGTAFLAWTTTPWTLPSNIALAVHPEVTYATVELPGEDGGEAPGERVVLAEALLPALIGDRPHQVVARRTGAELTGLTYEPPFRYAEPVGGPAYRVISADFVTTESGSGMVHVAPAFGEDDFRAVQEHGLGFLQLVGPDGRFVPEVTDFAGRNVKKADRDIIRNLRARGLLFDEKVYRHDYPFCWRAMDDPLIQYARRSWFIRTTEKIDEVIANNRTVHWEPGHIQEGRFGSFLDSNVDWALSRERFWGTPLPIWVNDETGAMDAVGSVAEILDRNPDAFATFDRAKAAEPDLPDDLRVHKPWIDDVTWTKPGEPGVYRRVPEVIDAWFDSGCMPFAQQGYPHRGRKAFERAFPADFITEAIDQTRGWFYSLMTISTLLFPERDRPHPFRNCVVLGLISDDKGQKLSKSKKNYTDPLDLIAQHGADSVRWSLYTGTVPGQGTRFAPTAATDALREFLLKVWNVYSFFVTYANIDGWTPAAPRSSIADRGDLDRYVLAELDAAVRDVREALDGYRSDVAARRLTRFVDAVSNWYVRRSRARFWAKTAADDGDKAAAFATLYEVLVDLSRLMAPFTPFVAEAMHQNLAEEGAPASVHLADFPGPREDRRDEALRTATESAREVVALGQRVRSERKLKVRQPLAEAVVLVASDDERLAIGRFVEAVRDELNVRAVSFSEDPARYVEFELVPNFRALGPKLGKRMPLVKKALAAADGSALYEKMEREGHLRVDLGDGGDPVTLGPDEVEIRLAAKEDFAAAASHGRVVVLDTRVDDSLRREGLAREVVNRVQRARKVLDLAFETRVDLTLGATGALRAAIDEHAARIAGETLAETLDVVDPAGVPDPDAGARREGAEVDGETLVLLVRPR